MPKNLIYIRYSTAGQEHSPETQEELLREYAQRSGLDLLDWEWQGELRSPILIDQCSGRQKLSERKEGGILARAVEPGDNVLIVRIDRLFRNISDASKYIDKWCERGVNLHIASFGGLTVDPRQWLGKMILKFFCWLAEFEAEMLRERVREERAVKRKNRERTSRYPGPGFKFIRQGAHSDGRPRFIVAPDFDEIGLMKEMLAWSEGGASLDEIVRHLEKHNIRRKFTVVAQKLKDGKPVYETKEVTKSWRRTSVYKAIQSAKGMCNVPAVRQEEVGPGHGEYGSAPE